MTKKTLKLEFCKFHHTQLKNNKCPNCEPREIEKYSDFHYIEKEILKKEGFIVKCPLMGTEALKGRIKKEDLEKIFKNQKNLKFPYDLYEITEKGKFIDFENNKVWFSNEALKRYPLKIKHWEEYHQMRKMQDELVEADNNTAIDISPFDEMNYEEYTQIFELYVKKNKKLIGVIEFTISGNEVEVIADQDVDLEKILPMKINEYKKKAMELHKKLSKSSKRKAKKIKKKYGKVIEVDWDEGYTTYRKDNVLYCLQWEEHEDEEITEITNKEELFMIDRTFEVFIDSDNMVWEILFKKKLDLRSYTESLPEIECQRTKSIFTNGTNTEEKYREKAVNIYKFLAEEKQDITTMFAQWNLRFYKHEKKYFLQYKKEGYHPEPYSQPVEINKYSIRRLAYMFWKCSEWIKETKQKLQMKGKINTTGTDSRHIILDKLNGLPLFYGTKDYFPPESDVMITYEENKITIRKQTYNEMQGN